MTSVLRLAVTGRTRMANAVFTAQRIPSYDDLLEVRYHFPARYLRQAEQTVGDWIIYYEPRRTGAANSRAAGRQGYFATARVDRLERDPKRSDHYYARMSAYLEFTTPVPFKQGEVFYESGLRKADGSANRGKFGWNLRVIPTTEYRLICSLGFADRPAESAGPTGVFAEEPVEYETRRPIQYLQRPFRDAAFTRVVQKAYQNTCAMTGLKLINGGGHCEIEAAHIQPVSADGPDSPRNGLALSRTIHWMFDRGVLSVAENSEILTAKKLVPPQVQRLLNPNGKIILPVSQVWTPHASFIRYHRENIFKS